MDRQQLALIQIECQQFLNRVTMLTDQEQWDALSQCYTKNATLFRPSDSSTGIEGRPAILDSFTSRPPRSSCHILANSIFEVTSQNNVIATSRIWLMTGEASPNEQATAADSKLMVGTFTDTLIYENTQWLIDCRKGSIELKYNYK